MLHHVIAPWWFISPSLNFRLVRCENLLLTLGYVDNFFFFLFISELLKNSISASCIELCTKNLKRF